MSRRQPISIKRRGVQYILLTYIAACVAVGGAGREGLYAHGVLQAIAGLGISALIATWPGHLKLSRFREPLIVVCAVAVIGGMQLVPLPNAIWQSLPGRTVVVDGYANLGMEMPSLPISMNFEATLVSLGYLLPPMFVLLLSARIGLRELRPILPWFVVGLAFSSIVLGLAQVIAGSDSALYFYEFTSGELPVGFFSNVNHQATLMLISLPFCGYLLADLVRNWEMKDSNVAAAIVLVGAMFCVLIGLFAAGSVAGYILLVPVTALTLLAMRKTGKGVSALWVQIGALVLLSLTALIVATSPVLENLGVTSFSNEEGSRFYMWTITLEAIRDHWLFGSGWGTYESVIPGYEDPNAVTASFVAKAHNDYLQIIMEGGVFGLGLVLFSLFWIGREFSRLWSNATLATSVSLRKFVLISIFVVILHSLVDYPLRTPGIAAVLSLCVAIVMSSGQQERDVAAEAQTGENAKRLVL
ncbi:MAG: O-antigen ligase family protein [Pseudomonadota bacterium]